MNPVYLSESRAELHAYCSLVQEKLLKMQLELSDMIKICIFLKVMWLVELENQSSINHADLFSDQFNKRVIDLMRSEFSTVKFENEVKNREMQDLTSLVVNVPENFYFFYIGKYK